MSKGRHPLGGLKDIIKSHCPHASPRSLFDVSLRIIVIMEYIGKAIAFTRPHKVIYSTRSYCTPGHT